MIEEEDNKNKRKGWIASGVFHGVLLLAFLFGLAWQAPNPPEEEYGIELNFGTDEAGFGEVQPLTPAAEAETMEESTPESAAEIEEIVETEPVEEIPEPAETVSEKIKVEETPKEQAPVTQPQPSPTVVEEKPKVEEKKPEPKKPAPKIDDRSLYKKDGSGAKSTSHGDVKGADGDQGDPQGELDSRALYGKSGGGGGGPKLEIAGWNWDRTPDQKDTSNDNGFIVFEFKIDDEGYVTTIRTLKSTVSPQVTNFYKEQLRKTTFSTTSDNARPAPSTTGKVTFVIRSS